MGDLNPLPLFSPLDGQLGKGRDLVRPDNVVDDVVFGKAWGDCCRCYYFYCVVIFLLLMVICKSEISYLFFYCSTILRREDLVGQDMD